MTASCILDMILARFKIDKSKFKWKYLAWGWTPGSKPNLNQNMEKTPQPSTWKLLAGGTCFMIPSSQNWRNALQCQSAHCLVWITDTGANAQQSENLEFACANSKMLRCQNCPSARQVRLETYTLSTAATQLKVAPQTCYKCQNAVRTQCLEAKGWESFW